MSERKHAFLKKRQGSFSLTKIFSYNLLLDFWQKEGSFPHFSRILRIFDLSGRTISLSLCHAVFSVFRLPFSTSRASFVPSPEARSPAYVREWLGG